MDEVTRMRAIIDAQNEIIDAGSSMDDVMQIVTNRAMALTDATGGVVELAEGDEMVYAAAAGSVVGREGLRLHLHGSLSGLCVTTARPLICTDSDTDPRVDAQACRKVGARSMVVVPLIARGATVGVLKVLSNEPNQFNEDDAALLRSLAHFIATAIAQASEMEETRRRALTDSLTGLENRADFMHNLRGALARSSRSGAVVGVAFIDLDGFKPVNDTYGHKAGDHVLQVIADRLLATTRTGEHVARLGGDEFAIITENRPTDPIHAFIDRIEEEIAKPIEFEGAVLRVTASIGVATAQGQDVAESILARADAAMYAKKHKHTA